MKQIALNMWKEDQGFLTFEWILLVTLLTIGIVSGIAAVRDATIDELGDVARAMVSLDQSYTILDPLSVAIHGTASSAAASSEFVDTAEYHVCGRTNLPPQVITDCSATAP